MLLVWLILLQVFAIWFSKRRFETPVTPVVVVLGAWLLCVAAYESGVVNLYGLEWDEVTMLGLGLASFVLGCLLASAPRSSEALALRRPLGLWPILSLATVAFGGFAYLLYSLSRKVNLIVYMVAPEWVEELGFQARGVGYLNLLHIVLPALLFVQSQRVDSHSWMWKLLGVASLLTTPFAGIKSYFTQSLVCLLLAILFDSGRAALQRSLRVGAIGLVVVIGYFAFYDYYFKDGTRDYIGSGIVELPRSFEALARPLIYVTGPISTFGPFTRFEDSLYSGRASLRGAAKAIALYEPVDIPPHNAVRYAIPADFNTYTGFREAFEDFREAGMILIPFLTGLLVQFGYVRARITPTVPLTVLAAYLAMTQALSPFGGFLSRPMSIYFVVVLVSLHFVCVRASTQRALCGRGGVRGVKA